MSGPVRPSGYIGWASATGATNVTQPTDAQKSLGWAVNQTPPSSYENWLRQIQDQSLQYLRWRADLLPVVIDDLLVPSQVGAGGYPIDGATGSLSSWYALQPSGKNAYGYLTGSIAQTFGVIGARSLLTNTIGGVVLPGWGEFYQRVDHPLGRDFRFEFVFVDSQRPANTAATPNGQSVELGLFYAHSGMSGANPQAAFMWTGATGAAFGFAWVPSGKGQTSMSLGTLGNPTGLNKFTIENRSPTMAFYLNDKVVGAAPSPGAFGVSGYPMVFGSRFGSPNLPAVATGAQGGLYLDRVELSVARPM